MLLLEYSANPMDLLPRAITDERYSIAGKILSLNEGRPSEPLFQKGTSPFVEPLDKWVATLKEAGIGVIIENDRWERICEV